MLRRRGTNQGRGSRLGGETETGGRASTGTAARETPSLGSKHPGRYSEKKLAEELAATQPAWILGEEYIHELSGVVCSATISRFRGYCGAYSHWKFMDVPEIEADEPVTLEQCMSAKKGFFKTPDGK